MQFRAKIVGFAVLLAGGAAVCATLTLLLAQGIERRLESVELAENQLALYLATETNISDLLRLQITAAVIPSARTLTYLAETKTAIRGDVEEIRNLVEQEIDLRGDVEAEDLGRLDQIDAVLDDFEAAFEQMSTGSREAVSLTALQQSVMTVVNALDQRLSPVVDLAVAEEAAEVIAARNDIRDLSRRSLQAGTAAGLLTLLAAMLGTLTLLSSFMRPFTALVEGASRLSSGDLAFRIPEASHDELGRLSRDFNRMAAKIQRANLELRAEEEKLQERVAERTAELEEANERLAAQDETRRRFLADVSHELRTPLTVMRGEAEIAMRTRAEALDQATQEALAAVVEQSEHMSRLVDDLLFVARREAGEAPLRLTRLPIGEVLERSVAVAVQLARDPVLTLQDHDDALSTLVEVDRGRLHQLVMVLLDNALRYSQDDPVVSLEVRRAGDKVTLAVRDCGIGIPREDLPHVFDRFVRGSNATPGGTGLGLPVARAIAEAHGGTLSIDSRVGEGTCVTLSLPVATQGDVS